VHRSTLIPATDSVARRDRRIGGRHLGFCADVSVWARKK
jgi:hypothetical protein